MTSSRTNDEYLTPPERLDALLQGMGHHIITMKTHLDEHHCICPTMLSELMNQAGELIWMAGCTEATQVIAADMDDLEKKVPKVEVVH